jgi:hypothetical protein
LSCIVEVARWFRVATRAITATIRIGDQHCHDDAIMQRQDNLVTPILARIVIYEKTSPVT